MELQVEFGFDQCGNLLALAGLFEGESAVLTAADGVVVPLDLIRLDFGLYSAHSGWKICFGEFALPDSYDIPGDGFKPLDVESVALLIVGDLRLPELHIGFRDGVLGAALVPVPEAAVYEYDRAVFRQDYVRCAWESVDIQPVAKPRSEQQLTHFFLRLGVPRLYMRHI